jgi:hypothetical protein
MQLLVSQRPEKHEKQTAVQHLPIVPFRRIVQASFLQRGCDGLPNSDILARRITLQKRFLKFFERSNVAFGSEEHIPQRGINERDPIQQFRIQCETLS